jgi:hypothetical protein
MRGSPAKEFQLRPRAEPGLRRHFAVGFTDP